ncbi:MAG: dUTP diphosphatase [Blastocatellia bacterium]|nr:dUTP diphosphatase [Blastocatellia bacterium]
MKPLKVKRLIDAARLPTKMTSDSAGFDIYAAAETIIPASSLADDGKVDVGRALIQTGLAVEIPQGMVGRIGSRSGLSVKNNLEVGAGWIDADYRGEVCIELKNFSSKPFKVAVGDRVAQLVVLPLAEVEVVETVDLESSVRGEGGFGSTGKR